MRAESLRLRNVRNHSDTFAAGIASKINVFIGPNGVGKTSILEAIALTTLTKSFTTHSDAVLIRSGESSLEVVAQYFSDFAVPHNVSVTIEVGPPLRKTIYAQSERIRASSDLVGRAPVVILTPDEKIITSGSPGERRRFLNMVLSQASRTYLEDELEYRRALRQRNAILSRQQIRSFGTIKPLLEPWTALLVKHGTRIAKRRAEFVEEFRPRLLEAYAKLSEEREKPSLEYRPMGLDLSEEVSSAYDFAELFARESERVAMDETRRGATLFGPHRDELALFINAKQEARLFASQGQHKTLLVAMKLAEFDYLRHAAQETPMLLLDDVFSELDEARAKQLLELAQAGDLGQTFITSTEATRFEFLLGKRSGSDDGDHRIFQLHNGVIE